MPLNWGEFNRDNGWPGHTIPDLCNKLLAASEHFPISTRQTPYITFTLLGEQVAIHENCAPDAMREIAENLTTDNLQIVRGWGGGRVLSYKETTVKGAYIYFRPDRKKKKPV